MPLATSGSEVTSRRPRTSRRESTSVRLAATSVTSSGASERTDGCSTCWFCGICCLGSGPIAIRSGCTVIWSSLIATLTRVGGCGPGFVGVFLGAAAGGQRCRHEQRADQRQLRRPASPRDPSERNLNERQVDYASRNAIFTYGELRARLGLAADDRQADVTAGGGDAGAADPADLLLPEPQRAARLGRRRSAAARAGGDSACPCSGGGRPAPGRCSSPW